MIVIINGQPETIYPSHITLKQLLARVGKPERMVSVSLNDIVIPPEEWRYKTISDQDRVDYL